MLLAVVASAIPAGPAFAASVRPGPAGVRFYTPPPTLPAGRHGALIWARPLTGRAVLAGATNELLLYRSIGAGGTPVAVSGTVAIPKGRPPRGGWPVISFGHATVGLGDRCAPTRSDVLKGYERPLLRRWLRAGYAVARTDYEGLGTPGVHPDLIGIAEAHAMLDVVRAARAFAPAIDLGAVALAGHSVGGHAALWATAQAPAYTPDLRVRATLAFAPSSHLAEQAANLQALDKPSGDLGAVAAVIVRGAEAADPSLRIAHLLSARGRALYPDVLTGCLPELAAGPFKGVAPADLFQPDADLSALVARLSANDPEELTFHTPVRIEQGGADAVVFPSLTDLLVRGYAKRGLPVTYKRYAGVDHFGLVRAAADDAGAYLKRRLGR